MKRLLMGLRGLFLIVLLGVAAFGLVILSRQASQGKLTAKGEVNYEAYPPPMDTALIPTGAEILPTTIEVAVLPLHDIPLQIEEIFPRLTPRPTPTLRPNTTLAPYPTQAPAQDASGKILYMVGDQNDVMQMPIDAQGRKVGESIALPLQLDFRPVIGPASPDRRLIILLRSVEPGGLPYVYDNSSQQFWPLFRGHPYQTSMSGWPYAWHPNSRDLLFWLSNNDELWLVDVEIGDKTVLALTYGSVQGAAISPDGRQVAYIDRRGANEILEVVNSDGSGRQTLLTFSGISYLFGWSPSGEYILYAGYTEETSVSKESIAAGTSIAGGPLWLVNPQSLESKPLYGRFIFGWAFRPVWSPDGNWIAFTSLDEGQPFGCASSDKQVDPDYRTCRFEGTGVYIENVYSGELRRLAAGIEPIWSPDGSAIAFLSNQSGAIGVWTIAIDGTDLRQLTSDSPPVQLAVWIPDGR